MQKKKATKGKTVTQRLHTLTLRAVGAQGVILDKAMMLTRQKTASGAIWSILTSYEYHQREREQLSNENEMLKIEISALRQGISHFSRFTAFLKEQEKSPEAKKLAEYNKMRPQGKIRFDYP